MSSNDARQPKARTFLQSYWRPPRPHGEAGDGRSVSFLELFYDLVYVVVIAQATHHLAEHVSWRGVGEFAVVFGMIWLAWMNGTIYYDLHGREDGRTRTFVFIQMGLLALLAVFTSGATGADGPAFAVVYALYFAVFSWLWHTVRRVDDERWQALTKRYLIGMVASTALIAGSALVSNDDLRTTIWAVFVVGWILGNLTLDRMGAGFSELDSGVTESMIERVGLFTIIVLGEVVVGIVSGIGDADATTMAIVTGSIGLAIGFAYWWTYFDFIGGRSVRNARGTRTQWLLGHFPVTMAIAASGAAMVSLIEHASDVRTPENTAWLLVGSVAVGLAALAVIIPTLVDAERLPQVYRPLQTSLVVAAVSAVVVGSIRPRPWVLALAVVVILSLLWFTTIIMWIKRTDSDERVPSLN